MPLPPPHRRRLLAAGVVAWASLTAAPAAPVLLPGPERAAITPPGPATRQVSTWTLELPAETDGRVGAAILRDLERLATGPVFRDNLVLSVAPAAATLVLEAEPAWEARFLSYVDLIRKNALADPERAASRAEAYAALAESESLGAEILVLRGVPEGAADASATEPDAFGLPRALLEGISATESLAGFHAVGRVELPLVLGVAHRARRRLPFPIDREVEVVIEALPVHAPEGVLVGGEQSLALRSPSGRELGASGSRIRWIPDSRTAFMSTLHRIGGERILIVWRLRDV